MENNRTLSFGALDYPFVNGDLSVLLGTPANFETFDCAANRQSRRANISPFSEPKGTFGGGGGGGRGERKEKR